MGSSGGGACSGEGVFSWGGMFRGVQLRGGGGLGSGAEEVGSGRVGFRWGLGGFRWGPEVGSSGGGNGCSGWVAQVGGLFRWGCSSGEGEVQWGERSKWANVMGIEGEQKGKRWGGGGGELKGIFLQFEFKF